MIYIRMNEAVGAQDTCSLLKALSLDSLFFKLSRPSPMKGGDVAEDPRRRGRGRGVQSLDADVRGFHSVVT